MTERVHLTAGIDPGASSVKVAILRSGAGRDGVLLGQCVQRIRRRKVADVVTAAFEEASAAAGVKPADFDYVASTGDGDAVGFRTGHFYSMTTHARGALFLDPEARAALDIGGLHARGLRMNEDGRVMAHRMTSQCASGSGQFLENIARYLGVPLDDVGELSKKSESPEKVSSICAVLAETDVINMVARGIGTSDILKGIHLSIAGRLVQLLRAVGAGGNVVVTGGLSRDVGMVAAIEQLLAEEKNKKGPRRQQHAEIVVETFPEGILAGAIGAALLGAYRFEQLERKGRAAAVAAPAALHA
ncbi:MAG: benzoyl-CoA reductase subunit D [Polyangiaceae bacterium]|nr:benzoyl-CoA reductase subunit D [Polyangiaceae bacterium]